jgi:hypothetical protein
MGTEAPLIAPLDPAQVQRAAEDITTGLQRIAKIEGLKIVAAILALLLGARTAFAYGHWNVGLFLPIVIVVVFLHLQKKSRRRRMGIALPFVLQTLGLEQAAGGLEFNRSLPTRLLPRASEPLISTVFLGTIDGCPVAIAEIAVKDRNDDSDNLMFEGLALRVGLSNPLPDFLILDEGLSRKMEGSAANKWFFNKPHIDVGFLQRSTAFPRGMHGLGLWLQPSADLEVQPLAAILKVLSYPPLEAGVTGRIHSATNDEKAIFVALGPPNKSIRIGIGPHSAANARQVIHATYEWLSQPIALAKALIQAAKTAESKS